MIKSFMHPVKQAIMREIFKSSWRRTKAGQSAIAAFAMLKNSKKGQDAILMCNGPSLNKVPFEQLQGVYIIGLNKINLLFERTALRPNLIVAINQHVIEQNASFFNETDIPLMLSRMGSGQVAARQNVTFLNTYPKVLDFSLKPGDLIYERATVTYTALQIAFHMGFQRVAIVGADHTFNQVGKPNELQVSKGPDSNHFDPQYFGAGIPWQLADLEGSELAYGFARKVYEAHGRKLYNCTEGGKLEIFERMPLSGFMATAKHASQHAN